MRSVWVWVYCVCTVCLLSVLPVMPHTALHESSGGKSPLTTHQHKLCIANQSPQDAPADEYSDGDDESGGGSRAPPTHTHTHKFCCTHPPPGRAL